MTIQVPLYPSEAMQVISNKGTRKLHLCVLSPANALVAIAHDRKTLESPPPAVLIAQGVGGLPIPISSGIVEIEWVGELWMLGPAANTAATFVEIDVPD